ncbi:hypothetical protein [Vibrio cyclitrophicus]|uniref:hypothetical protein n=1 Tax=Vibrio cyclitrophicus TaxID=47951 RepID=UPI0002FB0BF8|nr:hypothetical protein [Vibrio cyclitrophicus]OEF28227.1 hypothetical protein OA9_12600 [Vibrio cyclitrophicus 1F97]
MDTSVIENVLTSTVFMGIAAFVARSLFTHYLNKDISNFKQQLQNDASKQVESYKSELEKDRLRLQISYGGIFEKQANAILELYQYLLKLDQARYLAVHDSKLPTDRRKEFMPHWREIRHKYSELRVLLPEHIDQDLEDFFSQMFKSILKYNSLDQRLTSNVSDEEYEKIEETQEEVFQFLEQKIPALQESLISEMRKTLGVHIEK